MPVDRVLVTGASGMVGYAVCTSAIASGLQVTALSRTMPHEIDGLAFVATDLCDLPEAIRTVESIDPHLVVNLAANTAAHRCETDPENARRLHIDSAAALSNWCNNRSRRIVHVSTEAVYDTTLAPPAAHDELDTVDPQGVYASTKLGGEQSVLEASPHAVVLRCTPVGITPLGTGTGLLRWLVNSLDRNDDPVPGFTDILFSPISSLSLAALVLSDELERLSGVYNWGCPAMTKFDFCRSVATALGFPQERVVGRKSPGERQTRNGALSSRRLAAALHRPPPVWEDELRTLIPQIRTLR